MLRPKTIFHILLIFLFVLSCSSSNDKPLVAPPKEKVSLPKLWGFAMDDFGPIILIEVVLVFGGVLLFAWWQLRDLKKEREKDLKKKEEDKS